MFQINERVEVPAHFDCWMMGDRSGVVKYVCQSWSPSGHCIDSHTVGVKMDVSKKLRWFPVADYQFFRYLSRGAQ